MKTVDITKAVKGTDFDCPRRPFEEVQNGAASINFDVVTDGKIWLYAVDGPRDLWQAFDCRETPIKMLPIDPMPLPKALEVFKDYQFEKSVELDTVERE